MTTPEERLCSRGWRVRNSAWTLWSLLPLLGLFNFVGFLIIGLRARNKTWLLASAGWLVYGIGLMIILPTVDMGTKAEPSDSATSKVVSLVCLICWIGGIIHTFATNRSYLKWRAYNPSRPWHSTTPTAQAGANPAMETPGGALPPAVDAAMRGYPAAPNHSPRPWPEAPATAAAPQWTGRSGASAAPPAPTLFPGHNTAPTPGGGSVDLNSADTNQLQQQLGLDATAAEAIVTARHRLGRYSAPDQIMTEAGIPPHIYLTIQDRITTSTPVVTTPPPATGRRLEF
ncbi:ComEA family DNA-binding protein [Nocardia sp. 004]|uniref:ComEA family DNA-binding protein n=1 Tax=Nocardia sp. 004 TaxID=3385978 RepID=UPI0039A2B6EF